MGMPRHFLVAKKKQICYSGSMLMGVRTRPVMPRIAAMRVAEAVLQKCTQSARHGSQEGGRRTGKVQLGCTTGDHESGGYQTLSAARVQAGCTAWLWEGNKRSEPAPRVHTNDPCGWRRRRQHEYIALRK